MGRVSDAFCCCFRVPPSTSYEIAPECDDDFVILKSKKSNNNDLHEHLIDTHLQQTTTSQIQIVKRQDQRPKDLPPPPHIPQVDNEEAELLKNNK